ncbi:MAG: hypothetical protein ABSE25_04180 [Syntrophorhabdales bacterium]|jgi:hypothetical protein
MEMIRLRTTPGQLDKVARLILDTVGQEAGEEGLLRVRMYHSANYQTDLALSLTWDTNAMLHQGSRAGISISEALKSFGLVEHSIWKEREPA